MTAIRPAVASDVDAILELLPRLAAFPVPRARRPSDLWQGDAELLRRWSVGEAPQCLVLVAVDEGARVVGVAMAQMREELISHEPSAHLEVLAVHADAEGRGIARNLVNETERAVQARGATSLTLHVFASNGKARALYQKLGFDGELIRYIRFFNQPAGPPVTQPTESTPPDAHASDPVRLGWMVGSPPPADKVIRFEDSSFFQFPKTRWAFSNLRQIQPTRVVPRGNSPVGDLPRAERDDIDHVTFEPIGGAERMTWAQSLSANYTDGIVILHRGRVIYERYLGALAPDRQHIAFSVTKSLVATIAATLVAEGLIDEQATVPHYLPELGTSGFADATIRQLLDMTTGLDYTEDYSDPKSPIWEFSRAGGFLPRPPGYRGAGSFFQFLAGIGKASPHGERFAYKTVNTDTIGWILRRVTGRSVSDLIRERLWAVLGVEQDGYFIVDPTGAEFAGGGFNLTLRDLARFGEMMRLEGAWNGRQVVPGSVIADIRRGGDRDRFALAGYQLLPGWSYRNMWWVSHNEHGAYMARGIHGQALYIDPAAAMVIARFASHPRAANMHLDPTSLPAYHAVARHLLATG